MEVSDNDEHSKVLRYVDNYGRKKFYRTGSQNRRDVVTKKEVFCIIASSDQWEGINVSRVKCYKYWFNPNFNFCAISYIVCLQPNFLRLRLFLLNKNP